MRFKEFLAEAVSRAIPQIWYHGSKKDFSAFDLKYIITEESIAQEGPGFYLTSDAEDAEKYGLPNGFLKTVKLTSKMGIRNEKSAPFREGFMGNLINKMPDKEDVLSNWAENPTRALYDLKKSILDSSDTGLEMAKNIWYECYKGYEIDYVTKLKSGGIDGFIVNKQNGVKHLICYNPDILKIIETKKL